MTSKNAHGSHAKSAGNKKPTQATPAASPIRQQTGGDGDGRGLDAEGGAKAEMGHGAGWTKTANPTSDEIKKPS